MGKRPVVFTLSLGFLLLHVSIWLVFAGLVLLGIGPLDRLSIGSRGILAALAVFSSGTLFFLFALLQKRNRIGYSLTLLALAGLMVLTFMDQVGFVDWFYLVITFAPFVLLLISRRWYFNIIPEKR